MSSSLRIECPKALWLCVSCGRKLQPVTLEKTGEGPDAVISCRCSRCKRLLGQTTEIAVQCLWSKRLKPEQGDFAEIAVRYGLVQYPIERKEL
jgi:hypothetical protein